VPIGGTLRGCQIIVGLLIFDFVMAASLFTTFANLGVGYLLAAPWTILIFAFQVWMFIHAVRNGEYLWAAFIFFGWGFSTLLYYFLVYRAAPSSTRGFELPGAHSRRRIKELQAQIHHLDKAHHHSQLGDIYFQQGKLDQAEVCYRAALERDPVDIDTRAHLGQCLLRRKRAAEAGPLLEGVVQENPKHDYGYSLMALAETLTALGDKEGALALWKRVTENHSYPRAKVQLAELYMDSGNAEAARSEIREVVADDVHAPAFQRKRDRVWVRRARALSKKLG
jgi:tetratricopeptide (TPR) repeat protein